MLVTFLWENISVFAWEPFDLPRVPREVIEHKLAIKPGAKPVKQKVHRQTSDRQKFIAKEIQKLLKAGFIREI